MAETNKDEKSYRDIVTVLTGLVDKEILRHQEMYNLTLSTIASSTTGIRSLPPAVAAELTEQLLVTWMRLRNIRRLTLPALQKTHAIWCLLGEPRTDKEFYAAMNKVAGDSIRRPGPQTPLGKRTRSRPNYYELTEEHTNEDG